MRSRRLLTRGVALVLAAGGLMVIPASPAFAHCGANDHIHPDQYNNGGIAIWISPRRNAPHVECEVVTRSGSTDPNIHCAKQEPDNPNDWVYAETPLFAGWFRESDLNVFNGDRWVDKCGESGFVHITQNP